MNLARNPQTHIAWQLKLNSRTQNREGRSIYIRMLSHIRFLEHEPNIVQFVAARVGFFRPAIRK